MSLSPEKPSEQIHADLSVTHQEAADWFAKLRNPKVSEAERQQFQAWLEQNPAHLQAYKNVQTFWNSKALERALSATPLSNSRSRHKLPSWWRFKTVIPLLAASVLLGVVLMRPNWTCLNADYCTEVGETLNVHLVDGSAVTLNSQTAINIRYQDHVRRVELTQGEALFEVKPNPAQPFVVTSQFCEIKVLGTQFTVSKDTHSDTVTVLHGTVAVSENQHITHVLHDNDRIILGENQRGNVEKISASSASAWARGYLVFENVNLGEVIQAIKRYRKGAVIFKNPSLKKLKVSGRFDIRHPDNALTALEQTLGIKLYRLSAWLVIVA